jgi:protein-S-isoprenylcysteine O-methyltransferase Ste14
MASSTTVPNERGARVRFPPPMLFVVALVVGFAAGHLHGAAWPIDRPVRILAGVVVVGLGVALLLAAQAHFRRTGQHPAPWKPSPVLILAGPYRFTRNPMYVGMALFTFGLGVALDALWVSAAAPLALLAVHFIAVRPEERYLTEKFGAPYDEYLRRVRRYL